MWLVSNKLYYTALWVTILLYNRMTVVVVYHLGQILYNLNLFITVLVADSCIIKKHLTEKIVSKKDLDKFHLYS